MYIHVLLTRTYWATSVFRIDCILAFGGSTLMRKEENLSLVTDCSFAGSCAVWSPGLSISVHDISNSAVTAGGWRKSHCHFYACRAALVRELYVILASGWSAGDGRAERKTIDAVTCGARITFPGFSLVVVLTILLCAARGMQDCYGLWRAQWTALAFRCVLQVRTTPHRGTASQVTGCNVCRTYE